MSRNDFKVKTEVLEKPEMFVQGEGEGGGVRRVAVMEEKQKEAALSEEHKGQSKECLCSLNPPLHIISSTIHTNKVECWRVDYDCFSSPGN